jgi:hypothetical protein
LRGARDPSPSNDLEALTGSAPEDAPPRALRREEVAMVCPL